MDAEKIRKLKDEAAKFLAKGRVDKALEVYAKVLEADPRDLQARLKCGDLYRRLGKDAEAIQSYHQVAEAYAQEGLLLKAIAVCKLILEIDENYTATQKMLADLYSKKGGGRSDASAPKAAPTNDAPPPLPLEMLDFSALASPVAAMEVLDMDIEMQTTVEAVSLPPPPPMEARDDLPKIPLFSDLSKNAFITLMERMKMRTAQPGEEIIKEGETGDSFFIVAQGKVRVEKFGDNGNPIVLATLGDGAFFGEMALLSDAPRTASIIAEEATQLFEISKAVLDKVTSEYSSVKQVLLRFYKQRLLANLMATSRIFKPLTPDQRKDLIEQFKSREVPARETLLIEGQKGDGLYMILSGRVRILKNKGEKTVVLARLKEGDVFGEMSLLSNAAVNATVVSETRAIILRLPRKSFAQVLSTHPQLLEQISELSDERQKMTDAVAQGKVDLGEDDLMLV